MPGLHTYIRKDVVDKLRRDGFLETVISDVNDFVNRAVIHYVEYLKKNQKKIDDFHE